MRVPVMRGVVERRLLVNYRADPDVVTKMLPAPFVPQLHNGNAVVGICLIRLGALRPSGLPAALGTTSENAAHRIAVRWHDDGGEHCGVYIPLRHSGSALNVAVGDRLFPGLHERADFVVEESGDEIAVAFRSRDGKCTVDAAVVVSDELIGSQLFASTAAASDFFRAGSAGFSPRRRGRVLDGLELQTDAWTIEPTLIGHVASSMFDDATVFPLGTIELDSALVMRGVPVEWHGVGSIPCGDGPRELSPN